MKRSILFLLLSLFTGLILNARTSMVTNTNDSGEGSLRQIIADASEGDIIHFDPHLIATGNATIKLMSEINLNKGLIIKGLVNGTYILSISGENAARIFNVHLESAKNKVLVIDSLVLMNGNAGNENGGAIFIVDADSLVILNSTFLNNRAKNGGGIYSSPSSPFFMTMSSVSIRNSRFLNNSAKNGGGVYSTATTTSSVNISNSTFLNNLADNNGGGVYSSTATTTSSVSVRNSRFLSNSAGNDGGGVYSYASSFSSSSVSVINSSILSNSAGNDGGGVYSFASSFSSSSVLTKGSMIAFNRSSNIYNSVSPTIRSMGYNIFSDSTLSGSVASDYFGITL